MNPDKPELRSFSWRELLLNNSILVNKTLWITLRARSRWATVPCHIRAQQADDQRQTLCSDTWACSSCQSATLAEHPLETLAQWQRHRELFHRYAAATDDWQCMWTAGMRSQYAGPAHSPYNLTPIQLVSKFSNLFNYLAIITLNMSDWLASTCYKNYA